MGSYHWPMLALSCRAKVADAASDGGEPSDTICVVADAAVSFRSDVWKHFVFPGLKNDKKRQLIHTFVAHIVTLKVQ